MQKLKKIVDLKIKLKTKNEDIEAHGKENDSESDEEAHYIKHDPVRKFQFDQNENTCLTNKFPEMLQNDDGKENTEDDDFAFAPGEGKTPKNILMDK